MKPDFNRPTLLVVEDDATLRYLVVAAAERTGEYAEIHEAPDGRAAVELITGSLRERVDDGALLILSDLSMPRLDGLELIRELKARPDTRDIPIAVMTSSTRSDDRENVLAAGAWAFFSKPQRFDEYTVIVASLPRICHEHADAATAR